MALNTFRLGVKPSSHYLSLFDEGAIKIEQPHGGQRCWGRPIGFVQIADADDPHGDRRFDVIFPVTNGSVSQNAIRIAKQVLAQVVEMDDAARSLPPDMIDHDENLGWVEIGNDEVRFRYFATTVNTEWDVSFAPNSGGRWTCQGIPRP